MLKKLYHFRVPGEPGRHHFAEGVQADMRRVIVTVSLVFMTGILAAPTAEHLAAQATPGWQLPPDADDKKNPHPVDERLLATGKAVFKDKCERCHGPGGLGDGPDADPDATDMDLTNGKRAEQNSDGIVFYKVWNGRKRPKMPAFSAEITEDQTWAVVAYVQSLRKK
jgi:mono/diheme cytochrome c family protein